MIRVKFSRGEATHHQGEWKSENAFLAALLNSTTRTLPRGTISGSDPYPDLTRVQKVTEELRDGIILEKDPSPKIESSKKAVY